MSQAAGDPCILRSENQSPANVDQGSPTDHGAQASIQPNRWLRWLGTLIAASLLVAAAPPYHYWPLAILSMAVLFGMTRQASSLEAGAQFFLCFTVMLMVSGSWWQPTLTRFAALSGLESWTYLTLICLWQALPYGLWGLLTRISSHRLGISTLLAAPLWFALIESIAPFSLKNYMAITLWQATPLIQMAELGGPPAVFALVVLISLLLLEGTIALVQRRTPDKAFKQAAKVLALLLLVSYARLWHVSANEKQAPSPQIGLVQPNFGNASMDERERYGSIMIKNLRKATVKAASGGTRLVVWPESAWPYLFDRNLKHEFPKGHPWELRAGITASLLFGTLSHRFGGTEIYNSAVLLAQNGDMVGRHDKNQLVPFAEYIPYAERFPNWAERMRKRLEDKPDLVKGQPPRVLHDQDLRIAPLICSEDLDVDFVKRLSAGNPNLLVAIASDAWFGLSAAPEQHLALAAFRSVETRRGLVRAANTGVSGFISATGRLMASTELVAGKGDGTLLPTVLQTRMPLLEIPSAGRIALPAFPWLCALGLMTAIWMARRNRAIAQ